MLVDPSMNIEVSILGKESIAGYETTDLKNFDSGIVRIISDVGFIPKVLYYSGAYVNTGPVPPKVEQETTYTVVWSIFQRVW